MITTRAITRLAATAAAVLAVGAAHAAPTTFNVKAEDFFGASGFGSGDSRLDVGFLITNASTQTFALEIGQSYSWTFGRVTLSEGTISSDETNNLGVTAEFDFNAPLNADRVVTTTAQAVTGSVSDNGVDFTIDWQPLVVAFAGGTFQISLNDLTFTANGSQNQAVTITLLSQGSGGNQVPEPGSLALAATALLGLGALSRRRRQG